MGTTAEGGRSWAEDWQTSWDRLEESLIPDRESRIAALVDVVAGTVGAPATVVDLACGTGTITRRLLDGFPTARSVAVDVDPVLLTIASATFADDERVRVVRADLRQPSWLEELPETQADAVLTATALHWLSEEVVRRLYADLAGLIRPGGVFAHAEVMPLADAPHLNAALSANERRRCVNAAGHPGWDAWWQTAARDPLLRTATTERRRTFEASYPAQEFSPPADWHLAALRDAGFAEAAVVWRAGPGAVAAAIR